MLKLRKVLKRLKVSYIKLNFIVEEKLNTVKLPEYLVKKFASMVMDNPEIMKRKLEKSEIRLVRIEMQKWIDWHVEFEDLSEYKDYKSEGKTFTFMLSEMLFNKMMQMEASGTKWMMGRIEWQGEIVKEYMEEYGDRTKWYLVEQKENLNLDSNELESLDELTHLYKAMTKSLLGDDGIQTTTDNVKRYLAHLKSYVAETIKKKKISDRMFDHIVYDKVARRNSDSGEINVYLMIKMDIKNLKLLLEEANLDEKFAVFLYRELKDKIESVVGFIDNSREVIINMGEAKEEIKRLSKELVWSVDSQKLEKLFLIHVLKLELFEFIQLEDCQITTAKNGDRVFFRS